MLYSLITQLIDQYSFLNVFKYLTFRTGLSMFTSMFVVLLIGTPFIKFFSARKILNPIRDDVLLNISLRKLEPQQWGVF